MSDSDASTGASAFGSAVVNLAIEAATGHLVGALKDAGLRSIVLKGPSIRQWLYGTGTHRRSIDADLLVSWQDREAVEAVLQRVGWSYVGIDAVGPGRPRCRIWQRSEEGVVLELHQSIAGVGVPAEEAWRVLAGDTDEMLVGGVPAEVLSVPARTMHVALHAAQHGERSARTLTDLALALEHVPAPVWDEAAALAVRLDATPAFVAGLRLLPEGEALLERMRLSATMSSEIALRARGAPPMAEGLDWFAQLPDPKSKLAFIARHLAPPAGYMRVWSPLARRGRIGLAAAYAGRPLWLLTRGLPALRAWRRARREVRAGQ